MSLISRLVRPALSALLAAGLLVALTPTNARAGAVSPDHRFERIGGSVSDPVAMLPMPTAGRLLFAQRDGTLRLVSGDGLVSDVLARIAVSQTCAGEGLLGAAWYPAAPGELLFVSYIAESPRKLTVAQFLLDRGRVVTGPDVLYQAPGTPSASCTNLGGGIAVTLDGKILLGNGDQGNQASASQITSPNGKILRLNSDGTIPSDNALPGSAVYALGIRNPTRITLDELSGTVYFIDRGPSANDELNVVARTANYGWPSGTGRLGIGGLIDPVHVWAQPGDVGGFIIYRSTNFGAGFAADPVFVSATSGRIIQIDTADGFFPVFPQLPSQQLLYQPAVGEPASFVDVMVHPDGYIYAVTPSGGVYRIRNDKGIAEEPSNERSVVPLLVSKAPGGMLEIAAERKSSASEYGLYHGNLATLATSGYSHGVTANSYLPAPPDDGGAPARFTIPANSVGGPEGMAYILMSADGSRLETTLGRRSDGVLRPGGGIAHTCEDGCDVSGYGILLNQCVPTNYQLNYAVQGIPGAPNTDFDVIAPFDFVAETDCKVTLMAVSAEWCPPCQAAALDGEVHWQNYGARGDFIVVDLIPENNAGGAATQQTVQNWQRNYDLTYPVVLDENYREFNRWWPGGDGACNGWPHIYLFNRDGKMTDFWCGFSAAGINAAVIRELGP